jgi:hypothetical protein
MIVLPRELPTKTEPKFCINPDNVVWIEYLSPTETTLMPLNGPDIVIAMPFDEVRMKLWGRK